MTRSFVRDKLSEYTNGGNAFLLYDYLLELKKDVIEISQEDLGKKLNKTRPSIKSSLDLLTKIGVIEIKYKKIKMFLKSNGSKNG